MSLNDVTITFGSISVILMLFLTVSEQRVSNTDTEIDRSARKPAK